jgi:Fe-coproporphyrin III synthase
MSRIPLGLARDIVRANLRASPLPYKVTFVATYHCNFRCEMCNIWQKKSVDEVTPEEVGRFFSKWSQFSWVHLTGGELFMRRDLEDVVDAIVDSDRGLYLLNFPTTGWFGDRTVSLAERILRRGIGRLMVTISIDGPSEIHDRMRGLPGSWGRAIDTYKRLRAITRSNYQVVLGMTLLRSNANLIDATIDAVRGEVPDFQARELHLNIGHESAHYFGNVGALDQSQRSTVASAVDAYRKAHGSLGHPVRFLEDRYQALVGAYYESGKSPLPCTAMASSCFIDAYWNLFPCSIWSESVGNLRANGFDLRQLWSAPRGRELRQAVVDERCPQCWTPCEAYPTILGNLPRVLKQVR